MRLLVAELAKLVRPLTFGVAGAAAVFCVLLAAGGAHNAEINARGASARDLVIRGQSNTEIAASLTVSLSTVKRTWRTCSTSSGCATGCRRWCTGTSTA